MVLPRITPMTSQPASEFETRVIDVLARLDTKMDTLLGAPGTEGRIPKLEEKVDALQKRTWVFGGALLGLGGVAHWLIDAYRAFAKH